jgi:hypothetical protein
MANKAAGIDKNANGLSAFARRALYQPLDATANRHCVNLLEAL